MTTPAETADAFAAKFPDGARCLYYPTKPFRPGDGRSTRISGKPWITGSGHVLVKVEGQSGGVSIDHITEWAETITEQMEREAMAGSRRWSRARRFAAQVTTLMRDFIPNERDCRRIIDDRLMEFGFAQNAEVISVPPEWDHLDKIQLDRAFLEHKAARVVVGAPGTFQNDKPPEWRQVLVEAKEKLGLYRAAHSGEYTGGVEYMALMRRIDAVLAAPTG